MAIAIEHFPTELESALRAEGVTVNAAGWARAHVEYPNAVERILRWCPDAQQIIDGDKSPSAVFMANAVLDIPMTLHELFTVADMTVQASSAGVLAERATDAV